MTESSDILSVNAEHQHVLCRVIPWEGMFGKDSGLVSAHQEIGHKDRTVVLEVVSAGPGNVSRGLLNPCPLKEGELVVANLFHRTFEVTVGGHTFSMFNWENIMAKIQVDTANNGISFAPLQAFLVCRPNEARAHKVIMGKSQIINPGGDAQFTGGTSYDHRGKPREQIKTVVEEVVQVGPGGVVDGVWQEPPSLEGDMVMYDTSVAPVRFMIQGQSFTLVHFRHVLLTVRDTKPAELAPPPADATLQ